MTSEELNLLAPWAVMRLDPMGARVVARFRTPVEAMNQARILEEFAPTVRFGVSHIADGVELCEYEREINRLRAQQDNEALRMGMAVSEGDEAMAEVCRIRIRRFEEQAVQTLQLAHQLADRWDWNLRVGIDTKTGQIYLRVKREETNGQQDGRASVGAQQAAHEAGDAEQGESGEGAGIQGVGESAGGGRDDHSG